MTRILTLLTALLLAPIAALQAASSTDARIVIASEAGAHLDSDVNKGGGTDDTALIQAILDRAPKLGALKLVVDGAILVKGLKVHSNTTIECLNRDCGFFLADHSDQHIIRNANQRPAGREDRNISFIGGTYNGNALKQNRKHPTLGWISAFSLHGVEQLLFRDVSITNMRTFGVHLTNWRRVVFENIYINLNQIPEISNQDGIHVQGPGEFLSMRNIQGRTWDDMIALNADDVNGDWDLNGKFVRNDSFGSYASYGPITDVDIDGVQAEDCAQVIRLLSRESRIDRVSIRNVKGTYRDFGVWISPWWREGGDIGRLEFENIDLRPVAPRAFNYIPTFLFWIAGKAEEITLKNIISHVPIDDRPLVWIQPDAKVDLLRVQGLTVFDPRTAIGDGPLIRADGRVGLLQVRDVIVQRPSIRTPAGSLIATSMNRSALKTRLETNPSPSVGRNGMRGWPEAVGYLTFEPQLRHIQIGDVVAEGLEHILDHQAGTIEALDLRDISIPATTKAVHQGGEAKIGTLSPNSNNRK
jgi:hypothetical protein